MCHIFTEALPHAPEILTNITTLILHIPFVKVEHADSISRILGVDAGIFKNESERKLSLKFAHKILDEEMDSNEFSQEGLFLHISSDFGVHVTTDALVENVEPPSEICELMDNKTCI